MITLDGRALSLVVSNTPTDGPRDAPDTALMAPAPVLFGTPLTAGSRLAFSFDNPCSELGVGEPGEFEVAVGAEAPFPRSLGRLRIASEEEGGLQVATAAGSCFSVVLASSITVELSPTEAMEPWMDAALFRTRVDGEWWWPADDIRAEIPLGESWLGRGRDRIYVDCEFPRSSPLAPGEHEVVMEATLPGLSEPLLSEPLAIRLECSSDLEARVSRRRAGQSFDRFVRRAQRYAARHWVFIGGVSLLLICGIAFAVWHRRRPRTPL